ncbi:MAG: YihY/virulence factor BrkB family protein [Haloplanus sp.]
MTRAALITEVLAVAREKRISANAASLAFYAFNAFVTLLVLIYAAFSAFGTGNALAGTLQLLTGVGAREVQALFERVGSNAAGRRRAVVLAAVIAVWSSLRLFRAIEGVFAEIYELRTERSFRRQVVDSVVVLVAVTALMVVMAAVGALFVFRTAGLAWTLLGPVFLWLALVVLFVPLYSRFSGTDGTVGRILPGAAVAAAGWTGSAIALRLYVSVSESVDFYGVVGAVLLVLTWLYVVGGAIILGVVLNAVLADRVEADREWYPFWH